MPVTSAKRRRPERAKPAERVLAISLQFHDFTIFLLFPRPTLGRINWGDRKGKGRKCFLLLPAPPFPACAASRPPAMGKYTCSHRDLSSRAPLRAARVGTAARDEKNTCSQVRRIPRGPRRSPREARRKPAARGAASADGSAPARVSAPETGGTRALRRRTNRGGRSGGPLRRATQICVRRRDAGARSGRNPRDGRNRPPACLGAESLPPRGRNDSAPGQRSAPGRNSSSAGRNFPPGPASAARRQEAPGWGGMHCRPSPERPEPPRRRPARGRVGRKGSLGREM